MRDDFNGALARVQSDYDFYIRCQTDPGTALADYSLSPQERVTLGDPELLAAALKAGTDSRLPSITIKISGTHDWVNRAAPKKVEQAAELIAQQVRSVLAAETDEERGRSTLRLMQQIG